MCASVRMRTHICTSQTDYLQSLAKVLAFFLFCSITTGNLNVFHIIIYISYNGHAQNVGEVK